MKRHLAILFSLLSCTAAHAQSLSDLPAGSAVNATDLFYDVQTPGVGGVKVTAAQIAAYLSSATLTYTNKTLASSTNVLGGVTMSLGADATGDIYYRNGAGVLTRLPIGSPGQALGVSGGLPAWQAGLTTTPGGSNTDVQFNATGIFGGDSGFTYAGTGQATLALGSITANAKALNITGTWNNGGITFDAPFFENITNTAAAAGSKLADIQLNGASVFNIATVNATNEEVLIAPNSGGGFVANLGFIGDPNTGIMDLGAGVFIVLVSGNYEQVVSGNATRFRSAAGLQWASCTTNNCGPDTGLSRDNAAVIDVGNSTAGDSSGTLKARRLVGNGTPTANSCTGFAASTGSTDLGGKISYTSATTCSITFANAFTNTPFCVVTPGSAASTVEAVPSTSGLAVTFGTAQTAFQYACIGT